MEERRQPVQDRPSRKAAGEGAVLRRRRKARSTAAAHIAATGLTGSAQPEGDHVGKGSKEKQSGAEEAEGGQKAGAAASRRHSPAAQEKSGLRVGFAVTCVRP